MAGRVMTAEAIQQFIQKVNASRFDKYLNKVRILSAENGGCVAELKVEKEHTNSVGTLHGGFSATLVDTISSYGLCSHEDCCVPAVTVDLHLSYIKGATIGDDIIIDSRRVRSGKTLAFLEVLITNKKSGELLVKGAHTRFLMRPKD